LQTTLPLRNELDPVATLRAEYLDVGEAGVSSFAGSDLLVAIARAGAPAVLGR
jgi:hypothetical protein